MQLVCRGIFHENIKVNHDQQRGDLQEMVNRGEICKKWSTEGRFARNSQPRGALQEIVNRGEICKK